MKDERAGVAIEEFVGLKPKTYLYLVNDNSEDKKAKDVNRNVVAKISHFECKDVLLNKKEFVEMFDPMFVEKLSKCVSVVYNWGVLAHFGTNIPKYILLNFYNNLALVINQIKMFQFCL